MAAILVDLDGTIFYWGTNNFLPNAKETLRERLRYGDQLIFTTRRDESDPALIAVMNNAFGIGNWRIMFGVDSPRIVINDDGAKAINHPRDSAWNYSFPKDLRYL